MLHMKGNWQTKEVKGKRSGVRNVCMMRHKGVICFM